MKKTALRKMSNLENSEATLKSAYKLFTYLKEKLVGSFLMHYVIASNYYLPSNSS